MRAPGETFVVRRVFTSLGEDSQQEIGGYEGHWYNFGRVHQTLRVTPAMEADISKHVWSTEEIVGLLV